MQVLLTLLRPNSDRGKNQSFNYLVAVTSLLILTAPLSLGQTLGRSKPERITAKLSVTSAGSSKDSSFMRVTAAQPAILQALPTLSVADATVEEGDIGNRAIEFRISLSAASSQIVSFVATAQAGTATGNADFGAGSIALSFLPGQTSLMLTVFVIGDTTVEGTEQFFLNLSNPVNTTIADGQGIGTIIDDDALILLTEENAQRAIALDSVLFTRDSFTVANTLNFSADHRTRVAVFAIGLKLAQNENASAVTATAEDTQGTIRPLEVEFVGKVPSFDWLTQVVLKLNDQITLPGDLKIKITVHSATSNTVLVGLKTQ